MSSSAVVVKDVAPKDLVAEFAKQLKSQGALRLPEWLDHVKTATFKELSPYDPDWYYVRAAACLRKVYLKPGVGVGYLRKKFGGSKHRGGAPNRHGLAAGGVIRHVLQQLEAAELVTKKEKGRYITAKGQRELDLAAKRVSSSKL